MLLVGKSVIWTSDRTPRASRCISTPMSAAVVHPSSLFHEPLGIGTDRGDICY